MLAGARGHELAGPSAAAALSQPRRRPERDQYFRVADVRDAAARLVAEAQRAPAAVIFGAERTGLTNEELDSAHLLIRIPANAAYASLNLAMAVQLVAYELYRAQGGVVTPAGPLAAPLATSEQMQLLFRHLAQVLEQIDFRDRTQSGTHLMARIRRFLQRADSTRAEVNVLRASSPRCRAGAATPGAAVNTRPRRSIWTTRRPRRWMRPWPP